MTAVPLRLRQEAVGALNLFSTTDGALDDEDLQVAEALADIATIGILQARLIRDQSVLTNQLETALSSHVGDRAGEGSRRRAQQHRRRRSLRAHPQVRANTNRLLSETATGIVDGSLTDQFLADTGSDTPAS